MIATGALAPWRQERRVRRLWERVARRGPDECWPWTGPIYQRTGYGQFSAGGCAHRVMWEIVNGPIQDGLWVLHKCDNRLCCNPGHLFLGTGLENIHDQYRKGRGVVFGKPLSKGRGSKLTIEQVAEIRSLLGGGVSKRAIARRFGVTRMCIRFIETKRNWAWTDTPSGTVQP